LWTLKKVSKCKFCRKPASNRFGLHTFCDTDCAYQFAIAAKEKAAAKKKKEFNAETRRRKVALKSDTEWKNEAQDLFNKMRRLEELLWFKERDIEPYCISCQLPLGNDQWCCGHFKTRKARSDLAFDRRNTFLQHNVQCNKHLSGDIAGYKIGLAFRFGEDEAKQIIEYCEVRQETPRRTVDDWQSMKKEFRREIKRLQSLL
jgi:hypothetical protein